MMVRLLGLSRGEANQSPREITRTVPTSESGENGWLLRFFDSAFFCEWIAVSYLYKHEHSGVRDYLCNRMYTLPLSGVESYLLQICYMLIHKPSPSLDKFVIDMCSKSLQMALKVHWFLMAELEESDDNDGIGRIQEKCQIAATLMGEWPTLVRPPSTETTSPSSKNLVLNRLFSSKQRLLSLSSSPPIQRSISFAASSVKGCEHEDGGRLSTEENKILKKFIPGQKVRDALLFRRSADKEEDDVEKEGFFKRLLRDSRDESDELSSSSEGFLRRLFRDSKNDFDEKSVSRSAEDEEKEGFFKKFFKEKFDDRRGEGVDRNIDDAKTVGEDKGSKGSEDEKDGFLRKFFKERFEDKKNANDRINEEHKEAPVFSTVEDDSSDFSLFRRIFRVHPDATKNELSTQNSNGGFLESSPGTESFFRKLFRDRDRSVEDSELFGSKKQNEKLFGSLKQEDQKLDLKPPRPSISPSQLRKGAYHESLDFVQSLCETSCGLVDIVPMEDRKTALCESLAEINSHVADTQNNGGICFPMGKKMHRVVHIPEDEAILLNSREKAPYLICIEVVKTETPSNARERSGAQKVSRGGIPLSNGDVRLPKPPPWAYPLWTSHDSHPGANDRMSKSASQAIDQAMTHSWDAKVKFVNVNVSLETRSPTHSNCVGCDCGDQCIVRSPDCQMSRFCWDGVDATDMSTLEGEREIEWVKVSLTADPSVRMDDIEDESTPRRKEHRRVPSTIAMEEVKAAAAKGEAPAGLPLKGAGQESSDSLPKIINGGIPKATDALSGELWNAKKDRIRSASAFGKLPGWELFSMIVKSGDDCRQEHLAVQLISHFYDIFQEAGLPLWLRPYEVIVTSSYTSLIETIPDTASLHSLKSRYPGVTSLRDFFIAKYQEHSASFKLAQRNFVESMAGYSLVCYLLQVKDRHNGNLLMDEEGHIIHIDFGFMLSNSPGGVNFESAPFKLTRELLEVMDSDADGVPSEFFDYFKVLCIQGFLACRKHAERIILLVEMLQDSGFPCFKGGPRTIQNLRKRFHLSLTEEQCVSLMLSLISSSLDAWRTRQYDYYQRVLNGIL